MFALSVAFLATLGLTAPQAVAQSDKPTLTVYTYRAFAGKYGPGARVKERFEAACACTLDLVQTDDAGSLLARLKLEGKDTKADVVLGLDTNQTAEARAAGLVVPHGLDTAGLDLPVPWTDDSFIPFDWGWFAFVYDSDKLRNPPASFKAFVEAADGPKIIIQDPRTSTPGLGLMLWVQALYGDKAGDVWARLAPRIVTVTKGWSEAYGLFLKGEADMVLSYTTSPAYHVGVEKKTNYKAAIFPEGHYLQVEVAGLVKSSEKPDLARSFLRFVLSEAFQSAMPEGNWMYPAKVPQGGLPASFAGLDKPQKSLLLAPEVVRDGRRAWTDVWLGALRR
ncbi:thiamine ABC transporter substrate binding subunit [Chelatococcus sp. SYSU_G07232]|uniref:Thiamine-binding periplasmic protein n=1 Tax=Chelatococcus albus TaxID=3047466 RepID=A0ABT7AKY9_9HYPH|nr:thiamine ABC transporter substrate binding subunit [Chelatococcus sp. SYSU_G07232]MDJ1159637.1 thiamine ABC transporter substrate binding subunit [Chelatococcus sp. SYSU_G07232]